MGWTVLYIAFGVVALWLLGEVLLQYKARLRWRLLAFTGFVGVVAGALIPSIVVIGIGIAAFATGQTFVTLSYRRGFSTGWALGGKPGSSRRRRGGGGAAESEPALEVSGLEVDGAATENPSGNSVDDHTFEFHGYPGPDGYAPPEDTGQYGSYDAYAYQDSYAAYDETGEYRAAAYETDGAYAYAPYAEYPDPYASYDGDPRYQQAAQVSYDAYGNVYDAYAGNGYGPQGYPAGQYPYGQGESVGYSPDGYSDPYGYYGVGNEYAPQGASYSDTPPGGVFFPQQRDPQAPFTPEQQPQTYDYGYYYDEQRGL